MALQEKVLALLLEAGEGYLSGEAMSRELSVSRAAVWKGVEALRKEGYEIVSALNRGYRLMGGPEKLRAGTLLSKLEGQLVGRELVCLETVDSTNNECKRRGLAGAEEGLVVLSAEQTAGRGRRGRVFQSLSGQGLYLSVLLRPQLPLQTLSQLTAWVAVAVCRGIQACCGAEPQIKWTNDIILNGKKLCGVLTELEVEAETATASHVVLGIGINVSQTEADFGAELRNIATSLAQEGYAVQLPDLAAHILQALEAMYQSFPDGKEGYLADYRRLCITTGKDVRIQQGSQQITAHAHRINDDFALVTRMTGGRERMITSGEVTVRAANGQYI